MSDLVVKIADGSVRGYTQKNLNNENFMCFEGIPYGEPPVGRLRYKEPVPVKPWKGIKDCLRKDAGCFRKDEIKDGDRTKWAFVGSEDCLNLNVYTRSLPSNKINHKPKAVMFYVHGGTFMMGSTEVYSPKPLMTEDIVLVTIHYRLGIFGFLAVDGKDLGVPGNAGMKDMVLALKWVQNNIGFFNGDPENVTIFGHSSGACAVNHLVLSPMAEGLFHKAIIQSASSFNHWSIGNGKNARIFTKSLDMGYHYDDIFNILDSFPLEEIVKKQFKAGGVVKASEEFVFGPVVEDKYSSNKFLHDTPLNLLLMKPIKIPIMIGYTDSEALSMIVNDSASPVKMECLGDEALVPHDLCSQKNSEEFKKVAKKIEKFYYGEKKPELISKETITALSDVAIIRGVIEAAKLMCENSYKSVFMYRFRTPMYNPKPFSNIYGVPHCAELPYLFDFPMDVKPVFPKNEVVRKWFVKMWTNFAIHGNPTYEKDEHINVDWEPVSKSRLNFLDIGNELKMDVDPEKERMEFWNDLYARKISE